MFEFVTGLVTTFVSAVTSIFSEPLAAVCAGLAVLVNLPDIINKVKETIHSIGVALGFIDENEDLTELGAKAMQYGVKSNSEFESTEKYIHYLQHEVKLDVENFNKLSEEQKNMRTAAGIGITTRCIEEKTGVAIPEEFLEKIARTNASTDEIKACFNSFAEAGLNSMGAMSGTLDGSLQSRDTGKATAAVREGLMNANPSMTKQEAYARMNDLSEQMKDGH